MTTALAQSLRASFAGALDQLASALADCPAHVWETDLWPDESPTRPHDGALRGSAPWILAHHALICLDYDVTAELSPWVPPSPVGDFLRYADPTRVFSKAELLDYLEHCRTRVHDGLAGLTDDQASAIVPPPHRYAGTPYGVLLGSIPPHLVEHATQIRQFFRTPRQ